MVRHDIKECQVGNFYITERDRKKEKRKRERKNETNKQTNKQMSKKTTKQTNKQTNKQANEQQRSKQFEINNSRTHMHRYKYCKQTALGNYILDYRQYARY